MADLRDESTEERRKAWEAIDLLASRAPEWIQERVAKIEPNGTNGQVDTADSDGIWLSEED